jgi:leader peptidase (prepilin peptidase) / N-methyltransferase
MWRPRAPSSSTTSFAEPMRDTLLIVYAGVLGACIGSFLNVCIYRWPENLSVISPPSRCPNCGSQIRWYDNVPVLGWLWLRGRCRACREPVSIQYPIIELLVAIIWACSAAVLGPDWPALSAAIFLTIVLGIALTDLRTFIIPHEFTMGGGVIGILLSFAPGGIRPLSSLIGAALGMGIMWSVGTLVTGWMKRRGTLPEDLDSALGGGDVWMMGMVGAFLGPAGVGLTIFLGAIAGIVVFLPYQLISGKRMIPFGVFLALGAALSLFFGEGLLAWYIRYATGA